MPKAERSGDEDKSKQSCDVKKKKAADPDAIQLKDKHFFLKVFIFLWNSIKLLRQYLEILEASYIQMDTEFYTKVYDSLIISSLISNK